MGTDLSGVVERHLLDGAGLRLRASPSDDRNNNAADDEDETDDDLHGLIIGTRAYYPT